MNAACGAAKVLVAGHICLDLLPDFAERDFSLSSIQPGSLYEAGPMDMALGGAVANTGIALKRLGIPVRLVGKVGNDYLGMIARKIFDENGLCASENASSSELCLLTGNAGQTSYSVVLSLTDTDRIFLHHPGVNNTFNAADIADDMFDGVKLFHFGYPPLMREIYSHNGLELQDIFRKAQSHGVITSLDMALPDANDHAAAVDWRSFLSSTLPYVDMFFPSIDEAMFFLNRSRYTELKQTGGELSEHVEVTDIRLMADEFISMGAKIVAIKLGAQGLYVKSSLCHPISSGHVLQSDNQSSVVQMDSPVSSEHFAPPFRVKPLGTTGAGDCTIAGFIAGIMHGLTVEDCMTIATAVGACSVEQRDATSGVLSWEETHIRIKAGWERCESHLQFMIEPNK